MRQRLYLFMETDPLTMLVNALEKYLKDSPAVQSALGPAVKNIEAYNKTRHDERDTKSEADLPTILLEQLGGPSGLSINSGICSFSYRVNVMIFTGEQKVTVLTPVLWALYAALVRATQNSTLTALKWRGEQGFVRTIELESALVGIPAQDRTPGMMGWSSVAVVVFGLWFNVVHVKAFASGE